PGGLLRTGARVGVRAPVAAGGAPRRRLGTAVAGAVGAVHRRLSAGGAAHVGGWWVRTVGRRSTGSTRAAGRRSTGTARAAGRRAAGVPHRSGWRAARATGVAHRC